MDIRIALDAMGGDHAPASVIEGAVQAALEFPDTRFILVGREEVILAELEKAQASRELFQIQPAAEVVGMGEEPAQALRFKKNSSMRIGVDLVKSGAADALVSAGNTGALMATSRFVLRMLPGIDRPAIATLVPSKTGKTMMLDLGANVECSARNLCQFAIMGQIYATQVLHLQQPKIGLLNVGEEDVKGTGVVKEAAELIRRALGDRFVGNVEGTDIYEGHIDVVVCDGFVGNISLKSSEGVVRMISHFLKESMNHSVWSRIGYLLVRPSLNRFKQRLDPRKYNGAMLLGLDGVVVKSHGSADGYAYGQAIRVARDLTINKVNQTIKTHIAIHNNGKGME
ncbi:MAG: phosphate acyltransferase PlsX [Magnetococcales bacterium]|nr:phosphate acyltransferase PlsX [Magnetococcales bacterium]MBF0148645.1 phosphate acyltransferase PlsX [Magnetococcales bacterium]MBF0346854.1 phosphate acyltransferase PlsX [Magnetococcales bacterium]MBF0630887.1 phosphate acyltransferase PlsX [Magnetococcales bacterium]